MQRHGQHPADAGRDQQVGHEPAADRHPGHRLLVGARVGVVRDDRGDPRGRGAAGRVEHEQELDQVLLDRRAERLDDEHVALPAVGLELDLHAVVGEAAQPYRAQRHAEVGADLRAQGRMGAPAEYGNLSHVPRLEPQVPGRAARPAARAWPAAASHRAGSAIAAGPLPASCASATDCAPGGRTPPAMTPATTATGTPARAAATATAPTTLPVADVASYWPSPVMTR